MKYKLKVKDDLNWISNIFEVKNTKDVLVLVVSFTPKYLEFFSAGSLESNGEWNGFAFLKQDETLYAEGEQVGEVMVFTENGVERYLEFGKYNVKAVFVDNISYVRSKLIYPK